jgi:hypothetical protein
MHNPVLKAMAAACLALAAGGAQATADPLHNAVITAAYNGDAAGMLGADHGFAADAGSNVSGLDPYLSNAEFISADYALVFDFAPNGHLTIYNNGPLAAGSYSASFDFGATLAAPITGFSVTDAGVTTGTPVLTLVNNHTIAIDLSAVNWNGDYSPLETAITLQSPTAPVPEPAAAWMLLAGLGLLGRLRRKQN